LRVCFILALAALSAPVAAEIPLAERRSGYEFMSRETRAMQDDEITGPAVLWLLDGEALWNKLGCASCHGDAKTSMKGVAARYPAFDRKLINLEQRINLCRTERQKAAPLAYESRDLLALTAFVARQSHGMPVNVQINEKTKPFLEAGRAFFQRRQGQLNLACTQCHDDNWGKKLAGNTIPQAHPTGYPLYRLEWQSVGSLTRRFRNCLTGMRAEPYAHGSPEYVELELYLMWRARGMKLDAPGVRP
jgi:sulfur-oxidizing protein SoxA